MIRAKFIGTDGSMGFRNGRHYWINIEEEEQGSKWVWVKTFFGRSCPYASMKLLQQNWDIAKERGEFKPGRR